VNRGPLLFALAALAACGPGSTVGENHDGAARVSGSTMGTSWNAVVPGAADTALSVQAAAQEALDRVDDRMSTWNPNSELSHFNHGSDLVAAGMSRETIKVVREALRVAALSRGAFDPTVLPLVQLWGFGPDPPAGIPTSEAIEAALANVGWRKITAEGAWLQRESASVQLDLSGVAKGWGVDQAGEALSRLGHENWLMEVGGEIRTRGLGPGHQRRLPQLAGGGGAPAFTHPRPAHGPAGGAHPGLGHGSRPHLHDGRRLCHRRLRPGRRIRHGFD